MVLVERYTPAQAMTIRCTSCRAERVIDAGEIQNEDIYPCPAGCPGYAEHKFWEADRCKNCRKLGFWDDPLDRCCSRVCQLQAEHKREMADA